MNHPKSSWKLSNRPNHQSLLPEVQKLLSNPRQIYLQGTAILPRVQKRLRSMLKFLPKKHRRLSLHLKDDQLLHSLPMTILSQVAEEASLISPGSKSKSVMRSKGKLRNAINIWIGSLILKITELQILRVLLRSSNNLRSFKTKTLRLSKKQRNSSKPRTKTGNHRYQLLSSRKICLYLLVA